MNPEFWRGRRVLLTGHTGFKGGWLALWLHDLGAEVAGYALEPVTHPSLFDLADVEGALAAHRVGDIRDAAQLADLIAVHQPEVVFHLAAQPIVRTAYEDPVETFSVNALGTATVLDAVRKATGVRAVVAITSDKAYDNVEWVWGYREIDRLGGHDPYSASKACAELAIDAFRRSYFPAERWSDHGVAVASTRAGNVIGGGDWSRDRLVPDALAALGRGETLTLRNPAATRPWQHVLEPLHGYLVLAERLTDEGAAFAEAWNFGPDERSIRSVSWVVEHLHRLWGDERAWDLDAEEQPHEATLLKLDSSKAQRRLGWRPLLGLGTTLEWIVGWERARLEGRPVRRTTLEQIADFQALASS